MNHASVLLIWAAFFWGFGFIATVWALESFTPSLLVGLRFGLAAVITGFVYAHRHRSVLGHGLWVVDWGGVLAGLFLTSSVIFQTVGLQTTSATKSAFILGLYVFFVPILERVFIGTTLHRSHWLFVLVATFGSYLMLGHPWADGGWSRGDVFTVISMLFASVQIFWLSKPRSTHPELMNFWQMVGASIPALALWMWEGAILPVQPTANAWLGLFVATVFATWLAFHLQVVSQRHLTGAVAALICLLESPFAAALAWMFLSDHLEAMQWMGCLLILLAALARISWDLRQRGPQMRV